MKRPAGHRASEKHAATPKTCENCQKRANIQHVSGEFGCLAPILMNFAERMYIQLVRLLIGVQILKDWILSRGLD